MIRVAHHSKTIGYAGTDRTAQLFVKYLNQIPDIEAFLVYRTNGDASRLEECKRTIGEEFLIPYEHEHMPNAPSPYLPKSDNLAEVLADLDPQIFHIHRGGWREWPGFKSVCPTAKFVETNIFAGVDNSPDIDLHIYISNFIAVRAKMLHGQPGPILNNPTEPPLCTSYVDARKALLAKHGLPDNAFLLGRVGRPDNFDPISLKAFKAIQKNHPHVYYLVVNPYASWYKTIKKLRIERVVCLPPIINDTELSQFYAGIDIYAHARVDGECQPCNLNEAMYHGKPVITHVADTYQGHVEQINDSGAGLVASHRNDREYAGHLENLILNPDLRIEMGKAGIRWAKANVDAKMVAKKLASIYRDIL